MWAFLTSALAFEPELAYDAPAFDEGQQRAFLALAEQNILPELEKAGHSMDDLKKGLALWADSYEKALQLEDESQEESAELPVDQFDPFTSRFELERDSESFTFDHWRRLDFEDYMYHLKERLARSPTPQPAFDICKMKPDMQTTGRRACTAACWTAMATCNIAATGVGALASGPLAPVGAMGGALAGLAVCGAVNVGCLRACDGSVRGHVTKGSTIWLCPAKYTYVKGSYVPYDEMRDLCKAEPSSARTEVKVTKVKNHWFGRSTEHVLQTVGTTTTQKLVLGMEYINKDGDPKTKKGRVWYCDTSGTGRRRTDEELEAPTW